MKYKKTITYILLGICGILLIYNSVFIEKLDEKKQRDRIKNFNPKEMVDYFWDNQLDNILKNAVSLEKFDSLLLGNPVLLAKQYGKTVGISSNYCFLIKGDALVKNNGSGKLIIDLQSTVKYSLLVKFIFSNTVRDASGYFNVDNFQNSMDFNAVSTELNAKIMKEVIADKVNSISDGTKIEFAGAVEVNIESVAKELDIVPLKLDIVK